MREIREETGYDAVVIHALGYIDEHKFKNQFMQRSYCYIAKAVSQQGNVELSEEEIQLGMRMRWMSIEEAIAKFQFPIDNCKDYSTRFMLLRDLTILEHASRWLSRGESMHG
ncbi:NUDIX domain-containing protein [Cohnella ginsengisoli]|uniref:NUDIX domain-containing protein n=1 Tax=Cohnella ginsengisoli TaxID=425004 RepID=A0A9X4KKC7_9BACL|nr:NUDIX domain-containing protein [Cohnella ginsengisoli]MDG0792999.1 NUDIX domain-containing protein [Cohnella ginsengisoli]